MRLEPKWGIYAVIHVCRLGLELYVKARIMPWFGVHGREDMEQLVGLPWLWGAVACGPDICHPLSRAGSQPSIVAFWGHLLWGYPVHCKLSSSTPSPPPQCANL